MKSKYIILVAFFLALLFFHEKVSADPPTNLTGWAWLGEDTSGNAQPVLGWLSLNCLTEQLDYCDTSDHGVHINYSTGNLSGYAWNDAFGWVDFDPQIFPDLANTSGGRSNAPAYLDAVSPQTVRGWAQRASEVAADDGWIQFDHTQPNPVYLDAADSNRLKGRALYDGTLGNGYIDFSDNCGATVRILSDGTVTGCARSNVLGNINFDSGDVRLDWGSGDFRGSVDQGLTDSITFDPNPFPALPNHTAMLHRTPQEAAWYDDAFNIANSEALGYDYGAGDITGWARIVSVAEEGTRYNHDDWGFVKLHRTRETPSSFDYGVTVDVLGSGLLSGFAWSAGGDTPAGDYARAGFGWIDFAPGTGEAVFNPPWVQTQQGDIYSQGDVGSVNTFPAPAGQFNATYLILSNGDITNFTSAEQGALTPGSIDFEQDNISDPLIDTPTADNIYTNILGSLDVSGLVARDADNKNKYGQEVDFSVGDTIWASNRALAGRVYHIDGNLTISSAIQFLNASGAENYGTGTVVVEGDIRIQGDVTYETGTVLQLRNLASIAWVAKGDIIIDNNVSSAVGVMVALGDDGSGGGQFITSDTNLPLELRGMVMAARFHLQRSAGVDQDLNRVPSERIIYDGRLLLNTPPGLQDVAFSLPIIRSAP